MALLCVFMTGSGANQWCPDHGCITYGSSGMGTQVS